MTINLFLQVVTITQIEEAAEAAQVVLIAEVQVAEDDEVEVIVGKWFIRLSSRIDFLGFFNKKYRFALFTS